MRLGRALVQEAFVEVVDQVGGAPVEVRGHRAHVGGGEARQHEPAPRRGQEIHEGLHVAGLAILERGVENDRGEAGDDPGPGPERVVGDLEEEGGEHAVPLRARAEDALGDIASASGLGARVPGRPPLHGEIDPEGEQGHPGVGDDARRRDTDGQDGQRGRLAAEVGDHLGLEHVDPAHGTDGVDRKHDDRAHLDDELDEVGPHHRPHARRHRVDGRDGEADAHGHDLAADRHAEHADVLQAERDGQDLDHGPRHPAEDDQVDRDGEIEGAKPAQEGRGPAAVAQLGQLHVRHDLRAAPEAGEEEDGEHAAHHEVPPEPVARHAFGGDERCDYQRRVGGEGGGDHGRARQPPRGLPAGEEVLAEALPAAPGEIEPDDRAEEEVRGDDGPVDRRDGHAAATLCRLPPPCQAKE